jgi:flagellar basal-body rod protein FlgC
VESAAPPRTSYEPGSTFADANGYVTMPNVNAVEEMVNMISAQQDYQANLEAFNVAKSLALRTLAI